MLSRLDKQIKSFFFFSGVVYLAKSVIYLKTILKLKCTIPFPNDFQKKITLLYGKLRERAR